jgi:hypothetical protein
MTSSDPIHITLSHAEALVLFDWLARFNGDRDAAFEDQAEERVLFDLEALLEKAIAEPVAEGYRTAVLKAREEVRDSQ